MTVITVFPDLAGKEFHQESLDYDVLEFLPPREAKKADLPLLKLARFGDKASKSGCYRRDENILAVCGAELDYDSGFYGLEYAEDKFRGAGIEAILYTSPSHQDTDPHWRALLPFEQEFSGSVEQMRQYRAEAVRRAEKVLGFEVANESRTLSQAFFYGIVNGAMYRTGLVNGTCIDRKYNLKVSPPPAAPGQTTTVNGFVARPCADIQGMVGNVLKSELLHESLRKLSASFAAKGMLEPDIVDTLESLMMHSSAINTARGQNRLQVDIPRLASSAVEKFSPRGHAVLHELQIVLAAGMRIKNGEPLSGQDTSRLTKALERIAVQGGFTNARG
jgi:hypothetical protein